MALLTWRIPPDIFNRFRKLMLHLTTLEAGSDPYRETLEDIRRLPGFPHHWDERNDEIQIEPMPPKQSSLPHPFLPTRERLN